MVALEGVQSVRIFPPPSFLVHIHRMYGTGTPSTVRGKITHSRQRPVPHGPSQHLYNGPQVNFGDLTPYLTYDVNLHLRLFLLQLKLKNLADHQHSYSTPFVQRDVFYCQFIADPDPKHKFNPVWHLMAASNSKQVFVTPRSATSASKKQASFCESVQILYVLFYFSRLYSSCVAWGQEAKLVLVGGRHSPAAPHSHALLLDFAAKHCETIELLPQQLTATWRQATVMLGNFLLMVGGRTVPQSAARTIAAFHLLDGRVVRGELPCGVHSTGVIKVRKCQCCKSGSESGSGYFYH
jgi:hypothetical protein